MKFLINLFLGIIFGFGLILSNIFDPATVSSFLLLGRDWTPTILFTVLGLITASSLSLFVLNKIIPKQQVSFLSNQENNLNGYNIFGAALFGIGWGLSGLCVSTATLNLAFGEWENLLFFIFVLLGFYTPSFCKKIIL